MLAAVDCKHAPLNETMDWFGDSISLYDLCKEFLTDNDIFTDDYNHTTAIIMQGY